MMNNDKSNKHGTEKLQKVLARAGLGSRRVMEVKIEEGRVSINGKRAKLGDRVGEQDILRYNGRKITEKQTQQRTRVLLYHKPTGEMCTRHDPEGRATVFDRLPHLSPGRWINVGRLDFHTAGLLVFTNDGELANQLMHPKLQLDREYAVRIRGELTPNMMQVLRDGVELEDGKAFFHDIQISGGENSNKWYHVVVQEGRNRLVRRLFESQEIVIGRLMRVRYGAIALPKDLRVGNHREMPALEVKDLLQGLAKANKAVNDALSDSLRDERA